jgi:hypothetical protein
MSVNQSLDLLLKYELIQKNLSTLIGRLHRLYLVKTSINALDKYESVL